LTQGSSWQFGSGSRIISYSFSVNDTGRGGIWASSPALANAGRDALSAWSSVANVTFVESDSGTVFTTSTSDIAITLTGNDLEQIGAVGLTFFPSPAFADILSSAIGYTRLEYPRPEGDAFLDNFSEVFSGLSPGTLGYEVILHELGHALGLKHPSDDGGNGRPTFTELGVQSFDTARYTLMSTSIAVHPFESGHAFTPMLLDILAIQTIYGANTTYRTGADVYTVGSSGVPPVHKQTIWDAGGIDTLKSEVQNDGNTIDLRPGAIMEFATGGVVAIAYNTIIENAIGTSASEVFIGNDADNTLDGGGGNDTLSGGTGVDIAEFAGARSAYTISKSGATTTVTGPDGSDTLSGIERVQFADAAFNLWNSAVTDVNVDGNSDLLWRNTDGTLAAWHMSGSQFTGHALAVVPSSWRLVDGHGDYNGDGMSDLLWHDSNGAIATWHLNGGGFSGNLLPTLPSSWSILDGHADYNGDGRSDLLLRNSDGTVAVWLMNGGQFSGHFLGSVPVGWSLIDAHGDYNGDGKSDLLWRNIDGNVAIWQMDGAQFNGTVLGVVPTSWSLLDGHSDYNGDGTSDLLWRANDGTVATWQMDGSQSSGQVLELVPLSWSLIDSHGDYNADGRNDLLWRSSDGTVAIWEMNGGQFTGRVLGIVPPEWSLIDGHSDYNGDGKSDLLWRHSDGTVATWQMGTAGVFTGALLGIVPTSWAITDATELGATVDGDSASNTLPGTIGRDTLYGASGNDTLSGGAGPDRFVYVSGNDGLDTITDFETGTGGDVLDIQSVLTGYLPGTSALADFVRLAESGGNATVSVNADGAGSDFAPLAVLQGLTGILLADLAANGNLFAG
ncbi:MAG: M10 family metallopeptidase C-terminal domain-containing protein, partial [Burkholderiales bacterium]